PRRLGHAPQAKLTPRLPDNNVRNSSVAAPRSSAMIDSRKAPRPGMHDAAFPKEGVRDATHHDGAPRDLPHPWWGCVGARTTRQGRNNQGPGYDRLQVRVGALNSQY